MKIKLQFEWGYFSRNSHFLSRHRWVISNPFGPEACKYSRIIKIAWMLMSWILASSAAMILTIVIFFSCRVNHKNLWHLSVEEEYQVHIDNYFHIEKKKEEKKKWAQKGLELLSVVSTGRWCGLKCDHWFTRGPSHTAAQTVSQSKNTRAHFNIKMPS